MADEEEDEEEEEGADPKVLIPFLIGQYGFGCLARNLCRRNVRYIRSMDLPTFSAVCFLFLSIACTSSIESGSGPLSLVLDCTSKGVPL